MARRTFDRSKTLDRGKKGSNISGIQSWSVKQNGDNGDNLKTRKQLTPFEIWQSDRSTAIKLNKRAPCYLLFYQRSSPSDVNSPSYFVINCWKLRKIRCELKVPPFVAGER